MFIIYKAKRGTRSSSFSIRPKEAGSRIAGRQDVNINLQVPAQMDSRSVFSDGDGPSSATSLPEVLDEEGLRRKKRVKRARAVKELIETEESYFKDLDVLEKVVFC